MKTTIYNFAFHILSLSLFTSFLNQFGVVVDVADNLKTLEPYKVLQIYVFTLQTIIDNKGSIVKANSGMNKLASFNQIAKNRVFPRMTHNVTLVDFLAVLVVQACKLADGIWVNNIDTNGIFPRQYSLAYTKEIRWWCYTMLVQVPV